MEDSPHDYPVNPTINRGPMYVQMQEDKLWGNIRRKARTDPGLQELLNQCIMYYELSKESNNR